MISFTSFFLAAILNAQVSWQFTNGPFYANIDDLAVGEAGSQVILYAADSAYTEATADAFVLKSTDRGESWVHMNIAVQGNPVTGTVKCVATFKTNPSIVYAGVFGVGIYKSTDGGSSWSATDEPDNKSFSRIVIHPTNPPIVWVGCQWRSGLPPVLYSSVDGGNNWTPRSIGIPNLNLLSVSDIAPSPNEDHVWISTYGGIDNVGIWRSLDGGETWEPKNDSIVDNLHLASLVIDPTNPDVLYCGNSTGGSPRRIYKTTTGTTTCAWQIKYTTEDLWGVTDLRVSPHDSSVIFASTGPGATGIGVLRSTNAGSSWTLLSNGINFKDLKAIELDPLNASIIYAGGARLHYKSSDGGSSWHERNTGALLPVSAAVATSSGRLLAIGNNPRFVFRREGPAAEWQVVFDTGMEPYHPENLAIAIDPSSANDALFGWEDDTDQIRIWRTTDGGLAWTQNPETPISGNALLTDLCYHPVQVVYGTAYHTDPFPNQSWIIRSSDRGLTWSIMNHNPATGAEWRSVTASGGSVYCGGKASSSSGPSVYKSTNDGSTWTNMSSGLPGTDGGYVQGISADPSDVNLVYAGTTEGLYKTTNGGSSWTYKDIGIGSVNIKAVIVHPTNTGVVYAVTDSETDPRFFRSTNGGQNWSELSTGLPKARVLTLDIDPVHLNQVYAATAEGVYSFTHTWTGNVNANTTFKTGQTYLVEGVLTVVGGKTLTVEKGARVEFPSNARLDVRGTFTVTGTSSQPAVFTRNGSSGTWTGIVIEGAFNPPTASITHAQIEHCNTALRVGTNTTFSLNSSTIDDAVTGIEFTTFSGSAPTATITGCELKNIATTGILITSFSNLTIDDNTISPASVPLPPTSGIRCFSSSPKLLRNKIREFTRGVQCLNSSSALFEDGLSGGYNNIKNNGVGVFIKDHSNPVLGYQTTQGDEGGQNCIYSTNGTNLDVQLIDKCDVFAQKNWWGETTPDPSDFSIGSDCTLDYTLHLSSCPPGALNIAGGPTEKNPVPLPALLLEAVREFSAGNYAEAISLFEQVIVDGRMLQSVRELAISHALSSAQHGGVALSAFLNATRGAAPELAQTIDLVLPHAYLNEGLVTEALVAYNANIAQYPESALERDGYFGLFHHALYAEEDTTEAERLLTLLQSAYPESEEAFVAMLQLEAYKNAAPMGMMTIHPEGSNKATVSSENLPKEFALFQNYPNPFNPTTVIKYELPFDVHVSLKLYDMLGREVSTLVEAEQKAGYHQAVLDGSGLATGVYFYRLTAGSFTATKKILMIK
jgi:tetratricopeptide (TPR) repeat protein